MFQYLIILLDKTSVSFCHYDNPYKENGLIPLDTLKEGVRFGMKENLTIQFVYPNYKLPEMYKEVIESIDHTKIMPVKDGADVWVVDSIDSVFSNIPIVLRLTKNDLLNKQKELIQLITNTSRLNIILTDVDSFTEKDFFAYQNLLGLLSQKVEHLYVNGKTPQCNILTDRMMLSMMNNCGAGDSCITFAPNGKFYICPAFYYDDENDNIGDLRNGLDIKNKQLYQLAYAPICRHCDAWQCKRCVWLNKKTTHEVNTPSHEQCVIAHLERNASRKLMKNLCKHFPFLHKQEEIIEIDYLDPYDKRDEW